MDAESKKDFFISYNRHDRTWAEWIAWTLESAGYSVVIQAWDFRPGGNFVLEMQRAASEAERTIAVLSENYLTSQFTQPEWAAAFAQDPTGEARSLIPMRVRTCTLTGMLAAIVYVDLVEVEEATARDLVLQAVQTGRAKPDRPPQFPGQSGAIVDRLKPVYPPKKESTPEEKLREIRYQLITATSERQLRVLLYETEAISLQYSLPEARLLMDEIQTAIRYYSIPRPMNCPPNIQRERHESLRRAVFSKDRRIAVIVLGLSFGLAVAALIQFFVNSQKPVTKPNPLPTHKSENFSSFTASQLSYRLIAPSKSHSRASPR